MHGRGFILSVWFEVALMHISYTAEFINRNQRIKLAFMEYRIAFSCISEKV